MAIKATIFKADLQIADMDRNYYADHTLTLAKQPSETDERMMVRLLAFVLHASEQLSLGKGLCLDDEPDLWRRDLTGAIELWIDVGLPDEKWTRKACGRAEQVVVVSYGSRAADIWWEQNRAKLGKLANLAVLIWHRKRPGVWLPWRGGPCACNVRYKMARSGSPMARTASAFNPFI